MRYISFGTMLDWVSDTSGLSLTDRRCEVVTLANRAREHMFSIYDEVSTFMDAEECVQVQCYPAPCANKCAPTTYPGVPIPVWMQTPEKIEISGLKKTAELESKWRSYHPDTHRKGTVTFSDRNSLSPIERLITPFGKGSRLFIRAEDSDDCGKKVRLRGLDATSEQFYEEEITLSQDGSNSVNAYSELQNPGGVVLPRSRKGSISIYQLVPNEPRRLLSVYSPLEPDIPSYRHYEVHGVDPGMFVFVKGSRRYTPLYFDHDVVETGHRLAIENATRFSRLSSKTSLSPEDINSIRFHAENVKKYLQGDQLREFGKATKATFDPYKGKRVRSRLFRGLR